VLSEYPLDAPLDAHAASDATNPTAQAATNTMASRIFLDTPSCESRATDGSPPWHIGRASRDVAARGS
jgi:hypothetical protein